MSTWGREVVVGMYILTKQNLESTIVGGIGITNLEHVFSFLALV
jgi:hypothetical protein